MREFAAAGGGGKEAKTSFYFVGFSALGTSTRLSREREFLA